MSIEQLMNKMKEEVEMGMLEADKFSGGNKSAGCLLYTSPSPRD